MRPTWTAATRIPSSAAEAPRPGVAVDSSHIYWANGVTNTGTINKANLDGTGVTTVASSQQTPRGVAVGPQ
jgi:sugar lactone lactonase YvrE